MQPERKPLDLSAAEAAQEARPVLKARPQAIRPDPAAVVKDVLARFPKVMARLAE